MGGPKNRTGRTHDPYSTPLRDGNRDRLYGKDGHTKKLGTCLHISFFLVCWQHHTNLFRVVCRSGCTSYFVEITARVHLPHVASLIHLPEVTVT